MDISFLIVTKNRPLELKQTLTVLNQLIDSTKHEVLVFRDGCTASQYLETEFSWVQWYHSKKSLSASPARHKLYKKARGHLFIGLDDDAHPLSSNFIEAVSVRFRESKNLGILAFQEVRGVFNSNHEAKAQAKNGSDFLTNDFVGCGFAISRAAYSATRGFPTWIDIYGEESALALEVLDKGYAIQYCYDIMVNHRVDKQKRKATGRNYFRFEHQLQNILRYYMVYYPNPFLKIAKTLWHNFKKYACSDVRYFKLYVKVAFLTVVRFLSIWRFRKPVKKETIILKNTLQQIAY